MITGVGIDSVEIKRFQNWHTYPKKQLLKVFTETEITYCLSQPNQSAQRFAARFAVREAFFKALCSSYPEIKFPFLTCCKAIEVKHYPNGAPFLAIAWQQLNMPQEAPIQAICSLTHTDNTATALVILQK